MMTKMQWSQGTGWSDKRYARCCSACGRKFGDLEEVVWWSGPSDYKFLRWVFTGRVARYEAAYCVWCFERGDL